MKNLRYFVELNKQTPTMDCLMALVANCDQIAGFIFALMRAKYYVMTIKTRAHATVLAAKAVPL